MTENFTPEEEAEIELMLWEYDRDGKIAIDNFFRREPELSLRMASGVIPKRMQQDLIAFLKQRSRVRRPPRCVGRRSWQSAKRACRPAGSRKAGLE